MKQNLVYKLLLTVPLLMLFYTSQAQIEFKLQLMPDTLSWGVYLRHDGTGGSPSTNTITGSGQVTIVAPNGFVLNGVTSYSGTWTKNARVDAPSENPTRDYISVGFQADMPQIIASDTSETLLFTFPRAGDCPDTLYLIDNDTDPFNVIPNSAGTNPGNEISIFDVDSAISYGWVRNYAFSAWSCNDCDNDGYLNAIEDTNGNGVYDMGDTTDMCDACDPIHPLVAEIFGDTTMCGAEDNVPIHLTISSTVSGKDWSPYTVVYEDAAGTEYTVNNYNSGDPISVSPSATDTFTIVSVTDSRGCTPDTIRGSAIITVEGPIAITDDPDDVTECFGTGTSFSVSSSNDGSGTVSYRWQISTDDVTFTDISNGTPYTGAMSNTLLISNVAGLNARYYRAKIYTATCDTVYSASAQLTVEGPVTITQQPADSTRCAGESVTFISGATAPLGTVNTLWQVSTNGGSTYTDIADAGDYSGTSTGTLAISDVSDKYNYKYRLKAWTSVCDTVYSNAATLTVEGPIAITDQPDDVAACAGQAVNFPVTVTNGGSGTVQYQWQMSSDNGNNWTNLLNNDTWGGVRTDTLVADISDSLDGTWVRVLVWTGECSTLTSTHAVLTIDAAAVYSFEPRDTTVCYGEDAFFVASASVQQGSFTYQWQVSTDGGVNWTDLSDDATYSGVTNDTLFLTTVDSLLHLNRYRVQAVTGTCDPASSDDAVLNVEGPILVTSQVESDTICRGSQAIFDIGTHIHAGTIIYRWQIKPAAGSSWINLSNNSVYSGVATNRLTVNTDQGGNNGDQFRVLLSTATCSQIISDTATIVIEGPITVTNQPDDITVCAGNSTSFTAEVTNGTTAGTLSYQWLISQPGDTLNFTPLSNAGVYSGVNTLTLNISDATGLDSMLYRLQISTEECDPVLSDIAQLTVEGPLTIDVANQPDDVTLCADGTAEFFVTVDNAASGTVTYQWQVKTAGGGTWEDLRNDTTYNGVRSDTVSVRVTADMNGDSLRVIATTGTCGNITSAAAVLVVEGPLTFTTEARDTAVCAGEDAGFTIAWDNPGAGTVFLQWQVSDDDGANWSNVSNTGIYSGANSTTLSLSAPDSSYHDFQYRMAATLGTCGTLYSDAATLTIEGPLNFTDQPDDVTACSADDVYFEVGVSNGSGAGIISYQWQRSTDGGNNWLNIANGPTYAGANSPILGVGNTAGKGGWQFRCRVSTGECSTIISSVATLTVEGPITWTTHPGDATVCSGGDTTFTAAASNVGSGSISYQWEYSLSQFSGYTNVPDNAVFDDVTTGTLTVNDVAGLGGYYFRLKAQTGTCDWIYSEGALLTVEGPLSIAQQPVDLNECNANSVLFTVSVTNGGSGILEYQWERSRDGGSNWNSINGADTTFNGVRTDSLSISDIVADSLNGDLFRVRIWTSTCNTITSNSATLTIEGPLTFTSHPADTTVCSGQPAFFEIAADNGTGGTIQYQWQVSTNGVVWTNISGGVYSGFSTAHLDISDVAGLGGRRYRCRIRTGDCDWVYSQNARLTVEGPVTFSVQPSDQLDVCANSEAVFAATVLNGGSGSMSFQWEISTDGGSNWGNISDPGNYYDGETTSTLFINQVADSANMVYLDGYYYRLRVNLPTCDPYYSNEVVLEVVSDTLGHCDFDLDGLINDVDLDDDNDGVPDTWEYGCLGLHNYDVDADNDGTTDGEEDNDGDQISNREELDNDGVLDGDPCDPCDPLISQACFGISLRLKALMYGAAFDGTSTVDTLMKDSLRRQGLIPLTEPYSDIFYKTGADTIRPFEHVGPGGGETIADSAAVLGVTGVNAIVDWVFVELRSSSKIDSVIATRAALIQRDGDIVDIDGTSDLTFDNTVVAGPYYVAVRHRNHLGVMTVNAPELSPITREINFVDSLSVIHGAYAVNRKNNRNYMWAGDLRPDRKVIYQGPDNDILQIFLKVLTDPGNAGPQGANANYILYGYLNEDYDLDGKAIYQGPKNDRIMVLLQTVLTHGGNENTLANFIVLEQLP